jgi:hypothetical protein
MLVYDQEHVKEMDAKYHQEEFFIFHKIYLIFIKEETYARKKRVIYN